MDYGGIRPSPLLWNPFFELEGRADNNVSYVLGHIHNTFFGTNAGICGNTMKRLLNSTPTDTTAEP